MDSISAKFNAIYYIAFCGINEHSKVQSDIRISSVKSDVHITQIRIENESIVNLYAKRLQ